MSHASSTVGSEHVDTSALKERERKAAEAIQTDLEELRYDVKALAQALQRYGRLRATDLGAEASRRGHDFVDETRDAVLEMRRSLSEAEHELSRNVRSHPVPWAGAILGMVGAGLLVALLMERRS
ncbi:hypothetical protein AXZ77_1755 [Thioclava sp. ES.031]|uniref:hypothetical protein n=1 Tax=Thioclava sp. ES.031 TaxID=1798203 RepID=UPI000BF4546D|nr:hypothetical protein [Thioclava sp. ES.031]PFG63157.1 hypothetical protein AXZ77_1755 [Thioclava sp. ES.031]